MLIVKRMKTSDNRACYLSAMVMMMFMGMCRPILVCVTMGVEVFSFIILRIIEIVFDRVFMFVGKVTVKFYMIIEKKICRCDIGENQKKSGHNRINCGAKNRSLFFARRLHRHIVMILGSQINELNILAVTSCENFFDSPIFSKTISQ